MLCPGLRTESSQVCGEGQGRILNIGNEGRNVCNICQGAYRRRRSESHYMPDGGVETVKY